MNLIVADSTAIGIGTIRDSVVTILPTVTVQQLTGDIALDAVEVGGFGAVLLHVGTNDIPSLGVGYRRPIGAIVEDFSALLDVIRAKNSSCQVVFSAILPRPLDHLHSWFRVQQVNQGLRSLCSSESNVIFNPTYKFFVSHGAPNLAYFSSLDHFHPSAVGQSRLRQAFQQALSPVNLERGNHCHHPKRLRRGH